MVASKDQDQHEQAVHQPKHPRKGCLNDAIVIHEYGRSDP